MIGSAALPAAVFGFLLPAPMAGYAGTPVTAPPVVQRGMPADGQAALQTLIGQWRVTKTSTFPGIATSGPVTSTDLTATRAWVGDRRFVREIVRGNMGGKPYWRMGLLGYSNMDRRFEWVTVDGVNANMMIYLGIAGAGPGTPVDVAGTFTDQGLMGEALVGQSIGQRTTISFDAVDRTTSRLYVTPPGGQERLVDEMVFERVERRSPRVAARRIASRTKP